MRPISFLLFLILVSNTIHPQQLSVKSFGCYGGSETDYITNSIMTRDSSIYIVLRSFSQDRDVGYAPAESKAWIVKCNLAGDTIWTRSYYISSENYLNTIRELPGGNLILAGLAPFDYKIGEGLWIVVIDPDGNLLKSALYDNFGHTAAWDIRICDDDSFILAGETLDDNVPGFHKNGGNEDIIVQKWIQILTLPGQKHSEDQVPTSANSYFQPTMVVLYCLGMLSLTMEMLKIIMEQEWTPMISGPQK